MTLGLFVEARDTSANAEAASASASQLLDDLVADVKTTNDELTRSTSSSSPRSPPLRRGRHRRSRSNPNAPRTNGAHDGAGEPRAEAEPGGASDDAESETPAESPSEQNGAEVQPDAVSEAAESETPVESPAAERCGGAVERCL